VEGWRAEILIFIIRKNMKNIKVEKIAMDITFAFNPSFPHNIITLF